MYLRYTQCYLFPRMWGEEKLPLRTNICNIHHMSLPPFNRRGRLLNTLYLLLLSRVSPILLLKRCNSPRKHPSSTSLTLWSSDFLGITMFTLIYFRKHFLKLSAHYSFCNTTGIPIVPVHFGNIRDNIFTPALMSSILAVLPRKC